MAAILVSRPQVLFADEPQPIELLLSLLAADGLLVELDRGE